MKYAIETFNLTKKYGDLIAVNKLNFKVKKGTIFGLLGPNGAGKTTTVKMLTCLIPPTSGTAKVGGHDIIKEPDKVRQKIGMVPQQVSLYRDLTIRENLELCADYYGVPKDIKNERIDELLELVDIKYAENKLIKHLSGGQQQKASLAASLIHEPEILFLDEPTTGLDPTTKRILWNLVKELNSKGITIILCSHDMYEVELLCDYVGIINKGILVACDTPQGLKDMLIKKSKSRTRELSILINNLNSEIINNLNDLTFVQKIKKHHNQRIDIRIDTTSSNSINKVINAILGSGGEIIAIHTKDPSLEDVFIEVTKEKGEVNGN
ncbi:daunorubicin resistance ABC transporter ATPase subunit [Methanothermus fervidus DSM 2088]|uniref:Daunorubicin resistance ABC transporter ATPase subunit n=1 Tax=Methanothermus fervidus (strain ATCC 43054 / DSM 2088 / JCM 10308 / V24 S) TaxID=523846 RepID=E3GW27_METFV|nr:ATP-binding cassette domain-containing protein [Methanothermus fervidus]ADP77792.1 daunorubicin resistance ABC transporter ATPase subunit [Methanothermus fervidus DSM 2088]